MFTLVCCAGRQKTASDRKGVNAGGITQFLRWPLLLQSFLASTSIE